MKRPRWWCWMRPESDVGERVNESRKIEPERGTPTIQRHPNVLRLRRVARLKRILPPPVSPSGEEPIGTGGWY